MIRIKYLLIFSTIVSSLMSCGTFNETTLLDESTNYFPAKKNKNVNILRIKKVNPDTLKMLLVVPNDEYSLQMGKNLQYFNEVIIDYELIRKASKYLIDKPHLKTNTNSVLLQSNKENDPLNTIEPDSYLHAYGQHNPYVYLQLTKRKKKDGWYAGLLLYDFNHGNCIFENEIKLNLMWDGWTDQGTMYPLYNSLLDYLRNQ